MGSCPEPFTSASHNKTVIPSKISLWFWLIFSNLWRPSPYMKLDRKITLHSLCLSEYMCNVFAVICYLYRMIQAVSLTLVMFITYPHTAHYIHRWKDAQTIKKHRQSMFEKWSENCGDCSMQKFGNKHAVSDTFIYLRKHKDLQVKFRTHQACILFFSITSAPNIFWSDKYLVSYAWDQCTWCPTFISASE
jgi:multisubunit Na+/H+ antiporter MnhG subunit